MREEDFRHLDDIDRRILKYIFQTLHQPTREDIQVFIFPDEPKTKIRFMQRRLQSLTEKKYIKYHETGILLAPPIKERSYYLLAKGARAIGVTLKRSLSKPQKWGYKDEKRARSSLALLSYRNKWQISADNEVSKRILVLHIQSIIMERSGREVRGIDILPLLPKKVSPDIVIKADTDVIVCIIAEFEGEGGHFKRQLEKYKDAKEYFRFIVVTLNERQYERAIKTLNGEKSFIVIGIDDIPKLPELLN